MTSEEHATQFLYFLYIMKRLYIELNKLNIYVYVWLV